MKPSRNHHSTNYSTSSTAPESIDLKFRPTSDASEDRLNVHAIDEPVASTGYVLPSIKRGTRDNNHSSEGRNMSNLHHFQPNGCAEMILADNSEWLNTDLRQSCCAVQCTIHEPLRGQQPKRR
jgi:hypothetical protein